MSLLELQTRFLAEIASEDDDTASSSTGMGIYRDAYRGRLLAALETSFERTRRWVGAESFVAAACHYILATPPRGWTLDDYGDGFPALLEMLFADDPEVAELAWLEWHLQRAFAAPDAPELDAARLAAAGYAGADWDGLGFTMGAGFTARPIATDCTGLWAALADGDHFALTLAQDAYLLVWRSSFSPRFRQCDQVEYRALGRLVGGGSLGELAVDSDPQSLAAWLVQWLGEGIFASAQPIRSR